MPADVLRKIYIYAVKLRIQSNKYLFSFAKCLFISRGIFNSSRVVRSVYSSPATNTNYIKNKK